MNWVSHRGLVPGTARGALFGVSSVIGVPPLFCFPLLSFIVVSFFLNWVPNADTCPISLSPKLLGVVVKAEKLDYIRYKALDAIMAAKWL